MDLQPAEDMGRYRTRGLFRRFPRFDLLRFGLRLSGVRGPFAEASESASQNAMVGRDLFGNSIRERHGEDRFARISCKTIFTMAFFHVDETGSFFIAHMGAPEKK